MTERWLPVVGFEGFYEVSDLGNVVSVRTNHGTPRRRARKPEITHDGYLRVMLRKPDGTKKKKHVAHMVLEAFVGPRPSGLQACHGLAGQKVNALTNLRWDTPRSNYDDRTASGFMQGEKHRQALITDEIARKIKDEAKDRNILPRIIAAKYGVGVHVVYTIRSGKSWRSV